MSARTFAERAVAEQCDRAGGPLHLRARDAINDLLAINADLLAALRAVPGVVRIGAKEWRASRCLICRAEAAQTAYVKHDPDCCVPIVSAAISKATA